MTTNPIVDISVVIDLKGIKPLLVIYFGIINNLDNDVIVSKAIVIMQFITNRISKTHQNLKSSIYKPI